MQLNLKYLHLVKNITVWIVYYLFSCREHMLEFQKKGKIEKNQEL